MTYKNLQKFINENTNKNDFDLTSFDVKSKIIFTIGEHASNVACILSSIMHACKISHSRCINIEHFEVRDRLVRHGNHLPIDVICEKAHKLKRNTKGQISGDDLLLALSLSLLNGDYIIIEMSEDYYKSVINRINFTPFAILFCSLNDENNDDLIAKAPPSTHICALSQNESYDYISQIEKNGRKTALVSKNKITFKNATLLGTDFYHFSYLYRTPIIDQNNLLPTALAIEAATLLFDAPRPYVYTGLSEVSLPFDLKIYSIAPTVLLRIGDGDFILPSGLNFERITDMLPTEMPTHNTVFYGKAEYIEKVKARLKNAVQN